jgi:hypothetical protein
MKNLNEEIGRIKGLMGILIESTQEKVAVLIDGTSSAGKSMTAKLLNAVPFYEATDPNQWVIIASDDFNDYEVGEKRRLAFDPPSIRDWAKGHDFGITSGIYRKDGKDVPPNPKENEYVSGPNANAAAWYMAQEYKTGKWNKVIFDDVTNDILNYVPNIKHNILLHAPIYMLIKNLSGRNKGGKEDPNWREPTQVLDQYLWKYEATTRLSKEDIGHPKSITKKELQNGLIKLGIKKEYIKNFLNKLGINSDGKHYIKIKDEYKKPGVQLINVDSKRTEYLKQFDNIINK